jgi:hypothetical protein
MILFVILKNIYKNRIEKVEKEMQRLEKMTKMSQT